MTHCPLNHHITRHIVFVLVSTELLVYPVIRNPASYEIRVVILLANTGSKTASEIHCYLYALGLQPKFNE